MPKYVDLFFHFLVRNICVSVVIYECVTEEFSCLVEIEIDSHWMIWRKDTRYIVLVIAAKRSQGTCWKHGAYETLLSKLSNNNIKLHQQNFVAI